jgi:hypothetical protein
MEEAPENSKELSHSAHVNGMNGFVLRVEVVDGCHISSHIISAFTNPQQDPACLLSLYSTQCTMGH